MVAKLGPRFVFVQAYHVGNGEASSYANPRFANYRRDLQRLGLLHGAYLRCDRTANAETSIKRFWAAYTPRLGDLLPTLDIEDDYDDRCPLPVPKRIEQIEKMVRLVLDEDQRPQADDLHQGAGLERAWQSRRTPLIARYGLSITTQPPPRPSHRRGTRFSFWQYAENLHGNGVPGTYDGNYFNGTEADLQAYLLRG